MRLSSQRHYDDESFSKNSDAHIQNLRQVSTVRYNFAQIHPIQIDLELNERQRKSFISGGGLFLSGPPYQ